MSKLIETTTAKEFANGFLADPILQMAVNAVLDNAPNLDLVHCRECKNDWCFHRQYMKYELGIEDPFCSAGIKKNDE